MIEANNPPFCQTDVTGSAFTHLGLFEGIGGFSLAARWMGWETLAWCEWNEFGQRILKHHFPNAEGFGDITKTDFKKYENKIDILTGGFPCQPYSLAGKRKGKEDERHLWPEMLRAIREIQPTYVVGENVFGLINWNGGMVFNEVQADLEAEGYEVWPYVLPACAVNAPHRRDRVWFVAYRSDTGIEGLRSKRENTIHGFEVAADTNFGSEGASGKGESIEGNWCDINVQQSERREKAEFNNRPPYVSWITSNPNSNGHKHGGLEQDRFKEEESESEQQERERIRKNNRGTGESGITSDANNAGSQGRKFNGAFDKRVRPCESSESTAELHQVDYWRNFPTQSPICGGDDGLPTELDGITFSKWRAESIKAFGNAIVPQVAYEIFKSLEAVDWHFR